VAMDRTQLWSRRLLSGSFVVLAALGFRSVADGSGGGLLAAVNGTGPTSCLVGELSVEYDVDYVVALGGYGISGAIITGPATCVGKTIQVTFTSADGSPLGATTGALARSSSTLLLDPSHAPVDASQVSGIAVVLLS